MGYGKFGLKLFGSQVLMSIIIFFLFSFIYPEQEFLQWLFGIFFIALFWIVIYSDASYKGQNDLKRDSFHSSKGFISGLIASIPGLILYTLSLAFPSVWIFEVILRVLLIPYVKLFTTFENYMPAISIIFILFFPIITGLSYIDGIRRRKKIITAIEKKDAMRSELSKGEHIIQDNTKAAKKK